MPHNPHAPNRVPGVHDEVVMHSRITVDTSGGLRQALAEALRAKPATVSVDLSDVSYIDTSGLATLVEAVRLARKQGTRLLVVGMKDQPRYLFEITHLDRFFDTPAPEAST